MARTATVARRFAEALFELARRDGLEDAWVEALDAAAAALATPGVLSLVENPAVPYQERLRAIRAALSTSSLAAAVGPVADQLANLAGLLVERRRVSQLPAIAREYRRLLDRHRGVATAVVTSAAPLTRDELAAIGARVQAMTGTAVSLRTEVDPALIGGLTVRIGDRLLDASVRGRLERLRNQLLAGTRPAHRSGT
jgi:F-type H+-transporting ATPase subunit delta